ncbi:MAG: hypothetical protein COW84_03995 [Gammaproteobacteria bacterium CG22_combo_CG10-13_8_21_14_all_40_8]|nr:MAG: hypothetical protein COW84_03995 [Gammaproteobacteria bacterium CG22_combo_CG10-13_8_21_14_all_40_8]
MKLTLNQTTMTCLCGFCLGLALTLMPTNALSRDNKEEKINVAFLWNFILYTNWEQVKSSTLNLCTFGKISFENEIEILGNKVVNKKALQIKSLPTDDTDYNQQLFNCQILFFSEEVSDEDLLKVFASIKDRPILTVANKEGFIDTGGMINLIQIENKKRFEVNLDSARTAGIIFSSKMLKLSHRIIDTSEQDPAEEQKKKTNPSIAYLAIHASTLDSHPILLKLTQ